MNLFIRIVTALFLLIGSGSSAFAQQYCDSNLYTIGCGSDEIASFYTTGGMTNISNINSGCDSYPLSHTYYPSQVHKAIAGAYVNFTIFNNIAFDEGFKIFVDWNQDFDFDDAGESVFTTALPPGMAASGSFQIPWGLQPGLRRLRVRCASAGSFQPVTNFAACDQLQYGEAEDYNIEVAPNCNSITNLAMTAVTSSTASFSWSPATGAVGYQYAISVTGNAPATGNPVPGTSYTVTGLVANASYYFHVRTKCSDSAWSDWSAMAFNTNNVTTGIGSIEGNGRIKVYPNPAKDNIFIDVGDQALEQVSMYDLTGRKVAEIEIHLSAGTTTIQYSRPPELAPGLYLLDIRSGAGRTKVRVIFE